MMKQISFLLLACITVLISPAQSTADIKPRVSKCIYFDVSPPLRDMIKTPAAKADMSWKDGIVLNHLRRSDQPKDE